MSKGVLYAVVPGALRTLPLTATGFGTVANVAMNGTVPNTTGRFRLFKGTNRLYVTHRTGADVYNIAKPGTSALMQANATAALGWSHLVATGSNLADLDHEFHELTRIFRTFLLPFIRHS